MEEVPGSEKFFPSQLVFLALGFLGPESDVIKALGVKQDARSNIQTPAKVGPHLDSKLVQKLIVCAFRNTPPMSRVSSLLVIVVVVNL